MEKAKFKHKCLNHLNSLYLKRKEIINRLMIVNQND